MASVHHISEIKPHKTRHMNHKIPHPSLSDAFSLQPGSRKNEGWKVYDEYLAKQAIGTAIHQSSSSTLFKIQVLSRKKLIQMSIHPSIIDEASRDLLEISETGIIKPFSLPDLSDMALFPRWIKAFYTWLLETSSVENLQTNIDLIMREVTPKLPVLSEIISMDLGEYFLRMRSFSDDVKVIKLNCDVINLLKIKATSLQTTTDERDGRTCNVEFTAMSVRKMGREIKSTHGMEMESHNVTIVVWNCRGVGRTSFDVRFEHIVDTLAPQLLLLTETGVTEFMCRAIFQSYITKSVNVSEPEGLAGGMTIVRFCDSLEVKMKNMESNKFHIDLKFHAI